MQGLSDILGDYEGFFAMQRERLAARGIDVTGCAVSHLAYRTDTWEQYLEARDALERRASSNVENVWNGRPISKIVLAEPLRLAPGFEVELIELIPPFHQCIYRMGLEHVGFVIGDGVDEFGRVHRAKLTGQQFQSPVCEPYFIRFDDYTHVKFYRWSLKTVLEKEGMRFEGFRHADGWTPPPPPPGIQSLAS